MPMRPFIVNEKRYSFDLTNAYDLARLQKASAVLDAEACEFEDTADSRYGGHYPVYLQPDADMTDAARDMLLLCRRYYTFFEILFPGKGECILGRNPSFGQAREIFAKWIAYLRAGMEEERRADRLMECIYRDTDGDMRSGDGGETDA